MSNDVGERNGTRTRLSAATRAGRVFRRLLRVVNRCHAGGWAHEIQGMATRPAMYR